MHGNTGRKPGFGDWSDGMKPEDSRLMVLEKED